MNPQERFNQLKKVYYSLQEEPYEYSLNCDNPAKEVKEVILKFKELQKEIENKKYGCNKLVVFWDRPCGMFEDLKHSWNIILCPTCQKEKELDIEILKQIKEMLK